MLHYTQQPVDHNLLVQHKTASWQPGITRGTPCHWTFILLSMLSCLQKLVEDISTYLLCIHTAYINCLANCDQRTLYSVITVNVTICHVIITIINIINYQRPCTYARQNGYAAKKCQSVKVGCLLVA